VFNTHLIKRRCRNLLRACKTCFDFVRSTQKHSATSQLVVSIIASVVLCNLALAQVSSRQEEIVSTLRMVMQTDIPITQKLHQEFWSKMEMSSSKEQADFLRTTSVAIEEAHAYQIEVWESALLSFRKRKVIKSEKMFSLEEQMRAKILQTLPPTLSESVRRELIDQFDDRYKNSIMGASRLLEAAANHQTLQIPGRGNFDVNEATLQSTIARLKGTSDRLRILLNPSWPKPAGSVPPADDLTSGSGEGTNLVFSTTQSLSIDQFAKTLGARASEVTVPLSEKYTALIDKTRYAGIVPATDPAKFAADLAEVRFRQTVEAESRPTGIEMFGAAMAGNTTSSIFGAIFKDRFEPVEGFKPDMKNLPKGWDTDLADDYGSARSPEEAEAVLQRYQEEQARIKVVMDRGKFWGAVLRLLSEIFNPFTGIALLMISAFIALTRRGRP
jgi:hypothetical protein